MLNYVNGKIPNNLEEILRKASLTQADVIRISGLSRPTVKRILDGDDMYLSNVAKLCDSLGISISEAYGKQSELHQESHSYDNSTSTTIGFQHIHGSVQECDNLRQRIKDLEELVEIKDRLLASQEKLLKIYENKNND